VAGEPEPVLTPDTVDELPLALPLSAGSRHRRQALEIEEPGWIETMARRFATDTESFANVVAHHLHKYLLCGEKFHAML
jgi:hypothetical protein